MKPRTFISAAIVTAGVAALLTVPGMVTDHRTAALQSSVDSRVLGLTSDLQAASLASAGTVTPKFYSIVADTGIPPGTVAADVSWCMGIERNVPLVAGKIVVVTEIRADSAKPGNCEAVMVFKPSKVKSKVIRWAWVQEKVEVVK